MKGKYGGPISTDEFFQAIFQDRDWFREHGITHLIHTYLYFTPCNAKGQAVKILDQYGKPVDGYESAGGYHSAAETYESGKLEPTTLCRQT